MTLAELDAHPDLITHLDYPQGRCGATVRTYRGTSWRCHRRGTWLVQGQVPECGQHAALSLRRELQDRTDVAGDP